jgi:transcriptional regulator with XRE-family HTH domain
MRATPSRPSPLRVRRFLRGLRLLDLARLAGLHATLLSGIERGERPLRGRPLRELARIYATDAPQLVAEMQRWSATRSAVVQDQHGGGPRAA